VFADQAFETAQRLELFPEMGRRIPDARSDNARELILGNYRLAYRFTGELVEVLAVHHGARRPGNFEGS
jgi:toxin ParE1/3/4